jgi:hypothetical protein
MAGSAEAAVGIYLIQGRRRRELLFQFGEPAGDFIGLGCAGGTFLAGEPPIADGPAVGIDAAAADAEAALGPLESA